MKIIPVTDYAFGADNISLQETIAENIFYTIKVDRYNKTIHDTVTLPMQGQEFKNYLLRIAESFGEYNCTKLLSNDRHGYPLLYEDILWIKDIWEQAMVHNGLKHWAFVLPDNIGARTNLRAVIECYRYGNV